MTVRKAKTGEPGKSLSTIHSATRAVSSTVPMMKRPVVSASQILCSDARELSGSPNLNVCPRLASACKDRRNGQQGTTRRASMAGITPSAVSSSAEACTLSQATIIGSVSARSLSGKVLPGWLATKNSTWQSSLARHTVRAADTVYTTATKAAAYRINLASVGNNASSVKRQEMWPNDA
eukprot:6192512-Pleurochrysis_carterae.AAC.2